MLSARAEPTLKGRRNSREHFERLIMELTGCRTGDGTLEVADGNGRPYKNEHVQYFWQCYKTK
jgi:hypothetical protein